MSYTACSNRSSRVPHGKVLYEPGIQLRHVYFPTTFIVSLLYVMAGGASAEIAVSATRAWSMSRCLWAGKLHLAARGCITLATAIRIPGQLRKEECHRASALQYLLLRYTQAVLTQNGADHRMQSASFGRPAVVPLAAIESRPAAVEPQLSMTQELIANMLGVRLEGATDAAGKLQSLGLIKYSRAHITVLERPSPEKKSRECYEVVKKEFDRLLPGAVGA